MNIYLMRHGQKGYRPEMPLTPRGINEVQDSAQKLGELGIGKTIPGIVLFSPVIRAAETARIVGEQLQIPTYSCDQLEEWGLSSNHVPLLAQQLIHFAQGHQPNLDASASIIAVTHEPLISTTFDQVSPQTGQFFELPPRQDYGQASQQAAG